VFLYFADILNIYFLSSTTNIHKRIFEIQDDIEFNHLSLAIFQYQYQHCKVYQQYCNYLNVDLAHIDHFSKIPFLPVEFFKNFEVISDEKTPQIIFESSGTTGSIPSQHLVADTDLYMESFRTNFIANYGALQDWHILALLPSYLEKGNSSLVYMVHELMKETASIDSNFYLYDMEALAQQLDKLQADPARKTLLIGVTYALQDFAAAFPQRLANTIVMETGGMKGRRKEITRAELHQQLATAFEVDAIHSEYGMTELLSQAYAARDGRFHPPSWMKIVITDLYDPFEIKSTAETGKVNIIDLANLYSCSFISVSDMGKAFADGSFEISGRLDMASLRGCNLMID